VKSAIRTTHLPFWKLAADNMSHSIEAHPNWPRTLKSSDPMAQSYPDLLT